MSAPDRDLVGYGAEPPHVAWPGGARLALSLVVNYEEGSERTLPEDGENENLGETVRDVGSYRNLTIESVYEYGSRAGVHRLLRLLARHEARCTVFAAAVALERNPAVAAAFVEAGHEVAGHGWRWGDVWRFSREEERERIGRAVASIERTCGQRPVGWYDRFMPSEHTRELLVEEGGFLYDSNAYNDDIPYYTRVRGRAHLVLPYTLTYNDLRFVDGTIGGPSDFADLCRRAVDLLADEGETHPKLLSIGLHPRLGGQAGRASALADVLAHVRERGDVWIATRREIAEWWLAQRPPTSTVG